VAVAGEAEGGEVVFQVELGGVGAVGGNGPPLVVRGAFFSAVGNGVEDGSVGRDGGGVGAAEGGPVFGGEGMLGGGSGLGEGWGCD
jgi:hypothetical protein